MYLRDMRSRAADLAGDIDEASKLLQHSSKALTRKHCRTKAETGPGTITAWPATPNAIAVHSRLDSSHSSTHASNRERLSPISSYMNRRAPS